jgi:peroxiredoxin-like protein
VLTVSEHRILLHGTWQGGREGTGEIQTNGLSLPISVPANMKGAGEGTNPEELLLSAAASCYLITLGIMLKKRELPVQSIRLQSEGITVVDPVLRYDRIIHRPTILLQNPTEEQAELALSLAKQAELNCMVSNAMRGNVLFQVEPSVETMVSHQIRPL